MTRHRRGAVALIIVAVIGTGAGIALASIPDASGVIHGCRDNRSGAISVIDSATKSCPKGTSAINWNQTGPQGLAGATGAPGPQGPPGTVASLDAINGVPCNTADQANVGTTHVSYDDATHVVAITCPPNATTTTTANPTATVSISVGSQASQFIAANPDGTCPAGTVQVGPATCELRYGGSAQLSPPGTVYSVAFGQSTSGSATYAPGTQVTVNASPSPGSVTHWSGICQTATGNTCTFTVSGDATLSVFFGS